MIETLFWLALALIAYAYAGYPLLLLLQARLRPRPTLARPWLPSVSVVMAVHDGAADLARKLASLRELDYPQDRLQFVVVSDGSGDDTVALLQREAVADPRLHALTVARRRGKSACLADAVAVARGEVLLFTDVRQRIAPDALRRLTAALADPAVGAASGELRFEADCGGYGRGIDAYWRYETALRRLESASGSLVAATGALYAARREAVGEIPPGLILDDMWIPLGVAARGYRVVVVPDALAFDRPSDDPVRERARKRRTLAGNYQLIACWPALALPGRHPLWFRLWSHKFLRLAVPALLALALGANLALWPQGGLYRVALLAQCAAYALALLGMASAGAMRLAPVRLCAVFVQLNGYAVLGLLDFLRGRSSALWRPDSLPGGAQT